MDPDANSFLAVLAAVCAVLVACLAAGVVLLATRVRASATRGRDRLTVTTSTLRRDLPRVRERLTASTARLVSMRDRWAATDRAMTEIGGSLASVRESLERLTRGRLATLIRGAGIVSRVAQFSLLWR